MTTTNRMLLCMAMAGLAISSNAEAAELYVYGYNGVTNSTLDKRSSTGAIDIEREGVQDYFANGQTYRNVTRFSAVADYGINKVSSGASIQIFGGFSAAGSSSWTDYLTVRSSAASGFIRTLIDLSSDLDATPSSSSTTASYRLYTAASSYSGITYDDRSQLNSGGYSFLSSGAASTQHITQGPDSRRIVTLMIPFNSGQSFFISSTLSCSVSAFVGNIASCDAGHSTYWGGVVDVLDAQGNVVNDWTLTAQSGTDYTRSFVPATVTAGVPEPATWAMMIVGFGAVGGSLRRRRVHATTLAA